MRAVIFAEAGERMINFVDDPGEKIIKITDVSTETETYEDTQQ